MSEQNQHIHGNRGSKRDNCQLPMWPTEQNKSKVCTLRQVRLGRSGFRTPHSAAAAHRRPVIRNFVRGSNPKERLGDLAGRTGSCAGAAASQAGSGAPLQP